MRPSYLVSVLAVLLAAAACRHQQFYDAGEATGFNAAPESSLAVRVEWLKNKGDSIDLRVVLGNHYPHAVRFRADSFKLRYEGRQGTIAGREWTLPARQLHHPELLLFSFDEEIPEQGMAHLRVEPIVNAETGETLPAIALEVPVRG